MDAQFILQCITSVGFPIVCCGAMAWYVYDSTNKHRTEVQKLNDQHQEEMKEVTNAINNNTLVMQKLCDTLGKEGIA